MMSRKLFGNFFLNLVVSFGLASVAVAQQAPSASLLDPQTAEKANEHEDELYQSAKDALDKGKRVATRVNALAADHRREEIARMLAGAEITAEARAAADRLLRAATA